MVFFGGCNPWADSGASKAIKYEDMTPRDLVVGIKPRRNNNNDNKVQDIVSEFLSTPKGQLLYLIEEMRNSRSRERAERCIEEILSILPAEDDELLLRELQSQGQILNVLDQVLNRPQGASPLVAAPLLYKFARYKIGYRCTEVEKGKFVVCHRNAGSGSSSFLPQF